MQATAAPSPIPEVQINTTMGSFTVELYPKQAPKTCQNFLELACAPTCAIRTGRERRPAKSAVLLQEHTCAALTDLTRLASSADRRRGYYDNVIFHRIIPDFMVQGGDPTGTGRGGESIFGGKFPDEITRELKHTGGTRRVRVVMRLHPGAFALSPSRPLALCPRAPHREPSLRPSRSAAGILSMANAGPNTNGSQFFITLAPCPHLDGKHTVFGRISSGMPVVQRLGLARTDGNDRPIDPVRIVTARPSGAAAGTLATVP